MSRTLNPPVGRLVAPGLVLAVVAAGTLAACERSIGPTAPTVASSSAASASPSASGHDHSASAQGAASSGTPGAAVPGSDDQGATLGIRLQALLGQHTVLAADMMRARIRRDPDFAQAAEAALTRNTQAMATLVGSVFGSDAATAFSQQWAGHITHLFEYAEARQAKDTAGLERARQQLVESETALAAFFVKASNGRLPAATAQAGVKMHIDGLLAQADAYAKGDYTTAAADYQEAFQHTYALGGALAKALLPKKDALALGTPSLQLRSNLTEALSEHVALVVAAMRAASGNNITDFNGLGGALNNNTKALSGSINTLFGAPAAAQFQSLWADHVEGLMTLTSATARGDTAQQEQARTKLKAFEPALAAFLNTATQSRIGAQALARALAMHDQMLLGEVQAFQSKDYAKAHDLGYNAYDEMFGLAAQLSHAISLTLADKLPKGGSQTGAGGMAGAVGRR